MTGATVLVVAGLALSFMWVEAPLFLGDVFFVSFHLSFGLALLTLTSMPRRVREATATPRAIVGCSAFAALLPLLARFACAQSPVALALTGVGSGIAAAPLFLGWFCLCATWPFRRGLGAVLAAFALAGCVRLLPAWSVESLPTLFLLCAAALASGILLTRANEEASGLWMDLPCTGPALVLRAEDRWLMPLLLTVVCLLAFGFGFMRKGITSWSDGATLPYVGYVLRAALPLALLSFLLVQGRTSTRRLRGLVPYVILALVGMLACACMLFVRDARDVVPTVAELSRLAGVILLYATILRFASWSGEAGRLFGLWRGAYEVALAAGMLLWFGPLAGVVTELSPLAFYFAMSCILIILGMGYLYLLLSTREPGEVAQAAVGADVRGRAVAGGVGAAGVTPGDVSDDRSARLVRLGRDCGLTPRESQVLELICAGRSKPVIARELGVTENSVRWHARQLYAKTGVHSKQELIDLVESEPLP